MKSIIFSGRFDRYHIAHNITLARLAQRYDQVIVVVLDYEGAQFPVLERLQVISNSLLTTKGNFQIIASPHHFGEITKEQLEDFPHFDVYGTGNKEVLEHMISLKHNNNLTYSCEFVPRYPGYTARDETKLKRIKAILDE